MNKPHKTPTEPNNMNRKQQLHGKALISGTRTRFKAGILYTQQWHALCKNNIHRFNLLE